MATIAIPRPIAPHRPSSTISTPSITPPHSLEEPATSIQPDSTCASGPVPNKHIPVCPTGPAKSASDLETPPPSPGSSDDYTQHSLLYPADAFPSIDSDIVSLYEIDAGQVADAVEFSANQSLPPCSMVFPWFHGLHPLNHMQQTFFTGRRRTERKTPVCLRGILLVKADGDLTTSRLKGAVTFDEFMRGGPNPEFIDPDPREGFSVRNFQIQPGKMALVSDIVVYGEDAMHNQTVAWDIAMAQHRWRTRNEACDQTIPMYNTFVCTAPFEEFEEQYGHLVSVDSRGCFTGQVLDFVHQERREMWDMTVASEISHNVFMGPSPEPNSEDEEAFDLLIECSDLGRLNPGALRDVAKCTDEKLPDPFHDFPSSGSILPPTWSHAEADGIIATCKWIYHIAHGTYPEPECDSDNESDDHNMDLDGKSQPPYRPRRVLLHCADGYTESSMLGIAYFSFSTGLPVPEAWLNLHTAKGRNFFAYPTDVALLKSLAPRLLRESPACSHQTNEELMALVKDEPDWLPGLDGSLPSRVLDYLYLGNLTHANNPGLLQELGIGQILSVGETATWREADIEKWGLDNICIVQGVQDNGIDPLTDEFTRCLDFIGK